MRNSVSCFGENGVQVADASCSTISSSNKSPQNMVTCIYQCKLLGKIHFFTITWSKNMLGQCFSVEIANLSSQFLSRVDVKPSLFTKQKGFKCLELSCSKIYIYWDLSLAKFGSGPEPLEGFYLAAIFEEEMVLLIGDLKKEAFKKTNATPSLSNAIFISKREHIFGKRIYFTKARFYDNAHIHDLTIECNAFEVENPCLVVRVDSKTVLKVKHLQWKFRGNNTIFVDGLPIEIFWDVHNWFSGTLMGNGVFMFQTCLAAEKMWTSETFLDPIMFAWTRPRSQSFKESNLMDPGFSLTLYAWKNE